jgi:hypothetical protein
MWPQLGASDPDSLADQAYTLQAHCRQVVQFANEHPTRRPPAIYVSELAQVTNLVLTKLLDQRLGTYRQDAQRIADALRTVSMGVTGGPQRSGPAMAVAATMGIGTGTSSSATSGARRLEQWNAGVTGSPEETSGGPHLTITANSPSADHPAEEDLRVEFDGREAAHYTRRRLPR